MFRLINQKRNNNFIRLNIINRSYGFLVNKGRGTTQSSPRKPTKPAQNNDSQSRGSNLPRSRGVRQGGQGNRAPYSPSSSQGGRPHKQWKSQHNRPNDYRTHDGVYSNRAGSLRTVMVDSDGFDVRRPSPSRSPPQKRGGSNRRLSPRSKNAKPNEGSRSAPMQRDDQNSVKQHDFGRTDIGMAKKKLIRQRRELDYIQRARREEAQRSEQSSSAADKKRPLLRLEESARVTALSLSQQLGVRAVDVLKELIRGGEQPQTARDPLPLDIVEVLADHFGFDTLVTRAIRLRGVTLERRAEPSADEYASWPVRPPIVCVLGHVDHGKTSLLDALRESNVADGEAGGITQAISAFTMTLPVAEERATFIDTPGHMAFGRMRENGATIADMALLVVSATQSVQPQTEEAIRILLAANAPFIVCVNKCDLPDAKPDDVERELMRHGVYTEQYGGDVPCVHVSARTGAGLDELQVAVCALAEMENLRGDPEAAHGEAVVLESSVERGLGVVATVVVRRGALQLNQYVVSDNVHGRIRSLLSSDGRAERLERADAGEPVIVVGLNELVRSGADLLVADSAEQAARSAEAYERAEQQRQQEVNRVAIEEAEQERLAAQRAMLAEIDERGGGKRDVAREFSDVRVGGTEAAKQHRIAMRTQRAAEAAAELEAAEFPKLNVVCRADTSGALDVLCEAIESLPDDQVRFTVVSRGVGAPSATDIEDAETCDATVLCFGVSVPSTLRQAATRVGVNVVVDRIIYSLLDRVLELGAERLPPLRKEEERGTANVLQVFTLNSGSKAREERVAGCAVSNGVVARNCMVDVLRDGAVVASGVRIDSLRHVKERVPEVRSGMECGIILEAFDAFEVGDTLRCYAVTEERQTLNVKK